MSGTRRNRDNRLARLSDQVSMLLRVATSSTGSVCLLIAIAGATFTWAWMRWGHEVISDSRFTLSVDKIEVPSQPTWIQSNVKEEVVRDAKLASLSLLDHATAMKVDRAFALHRWVRRVERVDKQSSRRLIVQLLYRQPTIMVKADPDGFWPVDTEGYLLPPNEFSELQTREYLHVRGVTPQPAGGVGTPYGDERVAAAARIAFALAGVWKDLDLFAIEPQSAHSEAVFTTAVVYELVTRQGTRIVWGNPPDKERQSESTAADKVQRLVDYAERHGSLDGASVIDLTDFRALRITPRLVDNTPDSGDQDRRETPQAAQREVRQQR